MYSNPIHVRAALDRQGFIDEFRLQRAALEPPSLPIKHRQYKDAASSRTSAVLPPAEDLAGANAKPISITREGGEKSGARPSISHLLGSRHEPGFSTGNDATAEAHPEKHADRITLLEEQVEDLRIRRSNVNRLLSDLSSAAQPTSLGTGFKSARFIEQRKKALEEELDEIRSEEHQVGLKLHRASKRRRETGESGNTITWVGQRHPTFTDIKVAEPGFDRVMPSDHDRSQRSELVQPHGLDELSTAPQSSEIPSKSQTTRKIFKSYPWNTMRLSNPYKSGTKSSSRAVLSRPRIEALGSGVSEVISQLKSASGSPRPEREHDS